MHSASDTLCRKQCTQRKSRGKRLCDGDNVRSNRVMLIGEVFRSASETTLDLVEHQQCAGFLRQLTRKLQEFRSHGANPAFALNGLNANGADASIKLPLQISDII